LGVDAARPGVEGEDGATAVILAAQEQLKFELPLETF